LGGEGKKVTRTGEFPIRGERVPTTSSSTVPKGRSEDAHYGNKDENNKE